MPRLYASEFTTGGVHVIDIGTAAEVHVVATSALQVALSPDGQWLALAQGGPTVRFVQASTNTLGPAITTSLAGSYGLAWAPDSSKVYVSGNGDGIQSVQPDGTLGPMFVSTAVTTGKLALSPDGTTLYVCAGTDIYGVDASSGAFVHHFPGLAGTYGLAVSPDNAVLYATDGVSPGGNVYRITIATGTITGAGGGLDGPTDIAMSADGAHLWVAVNVAGQVKVLDAATLALPGVHTITVDHPYQLALTPDGTQMWVGRSADPAYPLDQVIYAYDTTTYAQTAGPTFSAFVQINSMSAGVSASGIGGGGGGGGSPAAATLRLGPMAVTVTGTVGAPTIAGHATLNLGPVVVAAGDHVTTRTATVTLALGPVRVVAVAGRVGPGAFPVPGFRGRWRLTLHQRAFAPATLNSTIIAELADAYGRQLVQAWDTPALLTFTLDGRSQSAALVEELLHDVVAWRWDDQTGLEQAVFRGPITQSEDQLTTDGHTVTYTCHDYTAMLTRRLLTSTYSVTGHDQDLIVGDLLGLASTPSTSSGTALSPAGFLPVGLLAVNGDGSLRGLSAQSRDRTYYGSQDVGQAVDDLAHVDGGFDYDIVPSAVDDHDSLRVFYPAQGVTRTDVALQYGSTVASLTRSVDSADYANYVRVLGNNQSANPTPQLFAEYWDPTAILTSGTPVGLWMSADDASDVTVVHTLQEKAHGDINYDAILDPSYTLNMSPNAYTWGNPNMGDVVPLIVQSGRLNVNTTVRVLGITYDIGDDGQEDVTLVVTRPQASLAKLFTNADRDVKALARR